MVFLLSFANFVVIQYRLLVEYIPFLKYVFIDIFAFSLVFFLVYVPVAIIIGWYDYRKLAVPVDTTVAAKANPWTRDLARSLILIAQGRNEDAIKILSKWTEELGK